MPNRVLWFLSSLLSKYDAQTGKFVHFCELAIVLGTSEKTIEISVATIM